MTARILIVEDDEAIVELLRYNLEVAGFAVTAVASGEMVMQVVSDCDPDLVVLDWMLPKLSGIEICRIIRATPETRRLPVIMLTARGQERDKLLALETGADDYIVKPFSMVELIARIMALLRRVSPRAGPGILRLGDLVVDTHAHRLTFRDQDVTIGPTEYRLLLNLLSRQGRVLTRAQLIESVWDDAADVNERTVDVHIGNLRRALAQAGVPDVIRTVRGEGYILGTVTFEEGD